MFDQVLYWITSGVPNNAESVLKNRKSNELPSTFQAVHLRRTLGVWSDENARIYSKQSRNAEHLYCQKMFSWIPLRYCMRMMVRIQLAIDINLYIRKVIQPNARTTSFIKNNYLNHYTYLPKNLHVTYKCFLFYFKYDTSIETEGVRKFR